MTDTNNIVISIPNIEYILLFILFCFGLNYTLVQYDKYQQRRKYQLFYNYIYHLGITCYGLAVLHIIDSEKKTYNYRLKNDLESKLNTIQKGLDLVKNFIKNSNLNNENDDKSYMSDNKYGSKKNEEFIFTN